MPGISISCECLMREQSRGAGDLPEHARSRPVPSKQMLLECSPAGPKSAIDVYFEQELQQHYDAQSRAARRIEQVVPFQPCLKQRLVVGCSAPPRARSLPTTCLRASDALRPSRPKWRLCEACARFESHLCFARNLADGLEPCCVRVADARRV